MDARVLGTLAARCRSLSWTTCEALPMVYETFKSATFDLEEDFVKGRMRNISSFLRQALSEYSSQYALTTTHSFSFENFRENKSPAS